MKADYAGCKIKECIECLSNEYEDPYQIADGVTQYIVKPLVVDESCGCIVQGFVKYVKDGKTVALVDYGDGTCDGWATKNICVDGNCEHKKASCCKFEVTCIANDEK
ncbi:MAG: hypothetical protein HRT71_20415 [Flavobacteriales bacterium]|nr:hypothetical protein [Flavobacteriales bacterium]